MFDYDRHMQSAAINRDDRQPQKSAFFKVGNTPVLIDLMTLHPYEPHHEGTYHLGGLQFRKKVKGVLTEWAITTAGEWFGKVTYTIPTKRRQETVTHWVPTWVLKRV